MNKSASGATAPSTLRSANFQTPARFRKAARSKALRTTILGSAALVAFPSLASAQTTPAPVGFESGGLTGWTTHGTVDLRATDTVVVNSSNPTTYVTTARETQMARIDAAGGLQGASAAESALGLQSGSFTAATNATLTSVGLLTRRFSLAAGTYSFGWTYAAQDYQPFNDGVFFSLSGNGLSRLNILAANVSSNQASTIVVGSYGSTPWRLFEFNIASAGTYQLGFGAFNSQDDQLDPILYIDDGIGGLTGGGVVIPAAPTTTNIVATHSVNDVNTGVVNPVFEGGTVLADSGSGATQTVTPNLTVRSEDGTFNAESGVTLTVAGTVSDEPSMSGGITTTGAGTIVYTNANTYTGGTTVNGGTLRIGNGSTSGSVTGPIALANNGNLEIARTGNPTFDNAISGAGNVTLTGGSSATLSGSVTNSGSVTVQGGSNLTISGTRSGGSGEAVTVSGSGGVLNVAPTGSVQGGQSVGVNLSGTDAGLNNQGSITNIGTGGSNAYGAAVVVTAPSGTTTITNGSSTNGSAAISGRNAAINHVVGATGALVVSNYGSITGDLYNGIENQSGAGALTVNNFAGGTIVGQGNAGGGNGIVNSSDSPLVIDNAGTVVGLSNGIASYGSGSVSITNSGTIGVGTVSGGNYVPGSIQAGGAGSAVYLAAGGSITNSGTITGSSDTAFVGGARQAGVSSSSGSLIVDNSGAISGGVWGVHSSGTIDLINRAGGTISGTTNNAIYAGSGDNSRVVNHGTLTGGNAGIYSDGTGLIITNTGTIRQIGGAQDTVFSGIYASAGGAVITNSGTIESTDNGGRGIYLVGGGQITNQAGGTIRTTLGNGQAIWATGPTTIVNSGTISAAGGAAILTGNFNDTVTLNAGSVTTGSIALGGGDDSLNFFGGTFSSTIDGGTGTDAFVSNLGTNGSASISLSNLSNFESYTHQAGALTLTGARSGGPGWTVSGGSLSLSGQLTNVNHTGVTLTGTGTSLNVLSGGQLSSAVTNTVFSTATGVTVNNAGTITSSTAVGIMLTGAGSTVTNSGTITGLTGTGSLTEGVYIGANNGTVTNLAGGQITGRRGVGVVGTGGTITNHGTVTATWDNALTLYGSGTVTNTGTLNATARAGAWGIYLDVGSSTATNSGTINASSGIVSYGAGQTYTVTNSGTIQASQYGVLDVNGTLNLTNTSSIAATVGSGVRLVNGTVVNSGSIAGGTDAGFGYGIYVGAGSATIVNQANGVIGGGAGAMSLNSPGAITVDLQVGSTTNGLIRSTGAGTRTVGIVGTLNGTYDASAGTGVDNVTLAATGAMSGASLGGGNDSFLYQGGSVAGLLNGGADTDGFISDLSPSGSASLSLSNVIEFETLTHLSGTLTLTGFAATPSMAIYAGNGGSNGAVVFNGTTGLTGDIYVNGATIRANSAGAFGTGTIHMIDPTVFFGATGTYANNFSLEVQTPATADPSTLSADAGVVATLTGSITQGSGAGVDPVQPLVIAGAGTIVLTNSANSWLGTTTINAGSTLQGASNTISGSAVIANGTLAYVQPTSGTVTQDISGSGVVTVSGLGAGQALALAGTTTVANGVDVLDASTLINSGTMSTGFANAVELYNGGSFINDGIVNSGVGNLGAAAASITNNGAINSTVFNGGAGTLTVTNTAGARVAAAVWGVLNGPNGGLVVSNAGEIAGTSSGISSQNAGTQITNTGTIIGGAFTAGGYDTAGSMAGINLQSGGTVNNLAGGLIDGGNQGIYSTGALVLTNAAGATIQGQNAINAYNAPADITNSGSLLGLGSAEYAVGLVAGGTVRNSGTIAGNGSGAAIITSGGDLLVVNQTGGTLGGTTSIIYSGSGAFTVDLQAGSATTGSIFNAGTGAANVTIAGSFTGANLSLGGGDGILTLASGATLGATTVLNGGAGTDSLFLTGGGNSTLDMGRIINFENRTMNGTGTWTLTGFDGTAASWQINSGTLAASGGFALSDTGTVNIGPNGTLQLNNNETIGALTGSGFVSLGANRLLLNGGTSNYAGVISGTGGLSITNNATVTLSGANTYTGTTFLNSGTLRFGASNVLADGGSLTTSAGTIVDLQGFSDTLASIDISGTLNGTGTLTAAVQALRGATINANLGAGTIYQLSGTTTLNGTAAADNVLIQGGTLRLGASDRLANNAWVTVASGTTLDLGANSDTVGIVFLEGTLNGTGTLTASQYQLTGATVNANLGAGTLFQVGGTTALNGTAAATSVRVQGGTLALGASNRLADNANVAVSSGAILNLGAFSDTVGTFASAGTLNGTGTLTAAQYQLSGGTINANLGAGTLFQLAGTTTLNGTAGATSVQVQGGTLALGASNRLADNANVTVSSGAILDLGAFSDTVGTFASAGTLNGTGTLTASQYQLSGGAINANLGAGTLFQLAGTTTLNGTSGAGTVEVQGGTLALGASNRLADTASVRVRSGAVLDLGANSDTVGALLSAGTLNGSGTLTASEYVLSGGTVNANLGAGALFQVAGTTTLNGTAGASTVAVEGGTLALGASNRLADTAIVSIAPNGTLDLGAFSDTIALLSAAGTLNGTGTLTAAQYQLSGATINATLGTGTLLQLAGVSTLNGTAAATTVSVQGGTLALGASNRLADNANVGVSAGATLDLGANSDTVGTFASAGTLNGTGTLTASQYVLSGGTINADLGLGTLVQLARTTTLNGTAASMDVQVQGGTLVLGASDRLADSAAVGVASGATLDIGANSDTVGLFASSGTLNGTGTLTASQYQLSGGTINANLGAGALFQLAGMTILNGTSGASSVQVQGGTLALGASNRLADTATVSVSSGATLNLGAFSDTVGIFASAGTLNGTGTLTAAQYQLSGGAINANLGTGALLQLAGTTILNGTAAAEDVQVLGGTLTLGASNRLSDSAVVSVSSGTVLDLGAFSDRVLVARLSGTLNGTGTLTAAEYHLRGATVNANLGAGFLLLQVSGTSILNGTAGASQVGIQAGTLRLGASERLANTASVAIETGATLDLAGFEESINQLSGGGSVTLGSGRLRVGANNGSSTYAGTISGTGSLEHVGTGLFTFGGNQLYTGGTTVTSGELRLLGNLASGVTVNGGTFSGTGIINGRLSLAGGTISPGSAVGQISAFQATSFTSTAGIFRVDVSPTLADFLSISGAATLNGGLVQTNITGPSSAYSFTTYLPILQAGSLTGTFANPAGFVATGTSGDLYERLRYDLLTNGVVLELRRMIDFTQGVTGNPNALGVAVAINGTRMDANDTFAGLLNQLSLIDAPRTSALEALSGEGTANTSMVAGLVAERFISLLEKRIDGTDRHFGVSMDPSVGSQAALIGNREVATLTQAMSMAPRSGLAGSGPGLWIKAYGFDTAVESNGAGQSDVVADGLGFAGGVDFQAGHFALGAAAGFVNFNAHAGQVQSRSRGSAVQGGVYGSFRSGGTFAGLAASYTGSQFDTTRNVTIGNITAEARGDVDARVLVAELAAGHDIQLSRTAQVGVMGTFRYVDVQQDAYSETGGGPLNLNRDEQSRQYSVATGLVRGSNDFALGGGMILNANARVGVSFADGDLDSALRSSFAGAPVGTGAFTTVGTSLPSNWGVAGAGLNLRQPGRPWEISVRYEGRLSERLHENQVTLGVSLRF